MKSIDLVAELNDPFKSSLFKGIDKVDKYLVASPRNRVDLVFADMNDMIIATYASRLSNTMSGQLFTISEDDKVALSNEGIK